MSVSTNIIDFKEKDSKYYTLCNRKTGKEEQFEMLRMFDFTSERKAMSVIVRDANGKVWAFVKGADSSILPMISHCFGDSPKVSVVPDVGAKGNNQLDDKTNQ